MKRAEYRSTSEQAEAIESQFARFALALDCAEPRTLPRTWGFEIETPTADEVKQNAERAIRAHNLERETHDPHAKPITLYSILEWKGDGSVTGENQNEDCECDCRECVYHSCDCDDCEMNNNGEPEHDCGSDDCYNAGQYQEITSVGGMNETHPLALEILSTAKLYEAEINDTCGLHIHIGSSDLTPAQVAGVISGYRAIRDIVNPIAERQGAYYCQDNTDHDIAEARQGRGSEKYRAVNTAPHFSNYRPDTIEFRQHAGTASTVAVRAWAVLLVALVEYAKRDQPVYWLARCRDFDELAKELRLTA